MKRYGLIIGVAFFIFGCPQNKGGQAEDHINNETTENNMWFPSGPDSGPTSMDGSISPTEGLDAAVPNIVDAGRDSPNPICDEDCATACREATPDCKQQCTNACLNSCNSIYLDCLDSCSGLLPCMAACSDAKEECNEDCDAGTTRCHNDCDVTEATCISDCGCDE